MPRKKNAQTPEASSGSVFEDFRSFTLEAVARSREADAETLGRIARRGDFSLTLLVASNPKTASETLDWIVANGLPVFRRLQRGEHLVERLAAHKAISVAAIATLLTTYSGLCPALLGILARNRHITADKLVEIAGDENPFVRRLAARHPATPRAVVEGLLDTCFPLGVEPGTIEHVRFRASQPAHADKILVPMAENPNAGPKTLSRLARLSLESFISRSYALEVWKALVLNPEFCGAERMNLLTRLLESSSGLEIVGRVLSLLELTEEEVCGFIQGLSGEYVGLLLMIDVSRHLKRASEEKKQRLGKNWAIVHRMIALSPDRGHRNLLAMSRQVDPDLLRLLAQDAEASVRRKVAENQNAPRDVLTLLSTDEDRAVRDAVLRTLRMYWFKDGEVQTSA